MNNKEVFYRTLKLLLIKRFDNDHQLSALDLSDLDDEHGRLQLSIKTKDGGRDLVVLNFSGSSPALHFGTAGSLPLLLQMIGPDEVILLGPRETSGCDKHLNVDQLSLLISQRIKDDLDGKSCLS